METRIETGRDVSGQCQSMSMSTAPNLQVTSLIHAEVNEWHSLGLKPPIHVATSNTVSSRLQRPPLFSVHD